MSRKESRTLHFLPIDLLGESVKDADHVIFVQKGQYIDRVDSLSRARLWLWLHNYINDEVPLYWLDHLRYRLGIICVSRTHMLHTRLQLQKLPWYWLSLGLLGRGGITYIHNPINDDLIPDPGITHNPNKLVFVSSPHKGLEQAVELFQLAHERNPQLTLYVADPGYMKNFDQTLLDGPGIIRLGSLPQQEMLRHVREALCVFYPQRKRPETFGLVYAEANAVGTPVLAHDFGAAREVLSHSNPPIDATDADIVLNTLHEWVSNGAPEVARNKNFLLHHIAESWDRLFCTPDEFIRWRETNSE